MQRTNARQSHDSGIVFDTFESENKNSAFKGPFCLNKVWTICFYLTIICILFIGLAGVGVSCYFLQPNWSFTETDSVYKWVGLGLSGLLVIICVILLCIFGFDHACTSSWLKGKNVTPVRDKISILVPNASTKQSIAPSIDQEDKKKSITEPNNATKRTSSVVSKSVKSKMPRYEDFSSDENDESEATSTVKEVHHHHYYRSNDEKSQDSILIKVDNEKKASKFVEAVKSLFKNNMTAPRDDPVKESRASVKQPRKLTARLINVAPGPLPPVIRTRGGSWILVNSALPVTPASRSNQSIILSARLLTKPKINDLSKLDSHREEPVKEEDPPNLDKTGDEKETKNEEPLKEENTENTQK